MKAQTLDEIVQQIETEQIRLDTQVLSRYQLTLTVRQIRILKSVFSSQTGFMKEIAQVNHITAATLTSDIKTLVKDGWILQRKDKEDKRVKYLSCTLKARQILIEIQKQNHSFSEEFINDIGSEEFTKLNQNLQKLLLYYKKK